MKYSITDQQTAIIKTAFAEMQTKNDFLELLNEVTVMLGNIYPRRVQTITTTSILNPDKEPIVVQVDIPWKKRRITEKQLNFFSTSFGATEKKRVRYDQFYIQKKSGQLREINAPVPKLKQIQRAVNTILQCVFTVQEPAYGFAAGKSIIDNAAVHAGKKFILNVDIKDFFPSIHFRRIKLMLEKAPFNLSGEREPLAFMIANLCTENAVLPQGAPTSPILTNIICQRLDRKLQRLAISFNANYSRYADDISFSSNDYIFTRRFMEKLEKIIKDDRFELNPGKTRIQGKAYRQEVTGLTVNEKVNVNRKYLRSYRVFLHLYKTKGAAAALEYHFGRMPESVLHTRTERLLIYNILLGKYNFIKQVKGEVAAEKYKFEPIQEVKIFNLASKIYGRKKNTEEEDTSAENIEPVKRLYRELIDEASSIVSEDAVLYNPSELIPDNNSDLIETILLAWEQDPVNTGFENAMKHLKTKVDE